MLSSPPVALAFAFGVALGFRGVAFFVPHSRPVTVPYSPPLGIPENRSPHRRGGALHDAFVKRPERGHFFLRFRFRVRVFLKKRKP
eukprot:CAMPEP_0117642214 /NCGR_PEP_ID=MMETSP0802-20121206/9751_1 /TAXON_ID=38833 /ORGANISM="Micromonas sp., Strain CCMP2099" /LENGTH=85 /DNA_ID=CAMNT_0005447219 /DNA_START=33 /DNA_END=287 /DNA_ORIENTATION=-